jgi:hypothetical protein
MFYLYDLSSLIYNKDINNSLKNSEITLTKFLILWPSSNSI